MAERRDPEGNLDPCGSCMSVEAPMVFASTPWCSDDCRKQMVAIASELRDLGPHGPGDPDLVHDDRVRGPHTSAFWIKSAAKPEDVDCPVCIRWAKRRACTCEKGIGKPPWDHACPVHGNAVGHPPLPSSFNHYLRGQVEPVRSVPAPLPTERSPRDD